MLKFNRGNKVNHKGYTLLEVVLFMALSSSLSFIAFVGLGPRLRNVRFSSAVRGVESSLNSTVNNALVGTNKDVLACTNVGGMAKLIPQPVNGQQGTSSDCVNGGLFAIFAQNEIEYYQVPLLRKSTCNTEDTANVDSAVAVINCYGLNLTADPATDYSTAFVYKLTNNLMMIPNPSEPKPSLGFVTNPDTNKKYIFTDNVPGKIICYELGGRTASLNFTNTSIEPNVIFDDSNCGPTS